MPMSPAAEDDLAGLASLRTWLERIRGVGGHKVYTGLGEEVKTTTVGQGVGRQPAS